MYRKCVFVILFILFPVIVFASSLKFELFHAAGRGNIKKVWILLRKGANVNARDYRKKTPLMYASSNGHLPVVKLLVRKGAKINAVNFRGRTALFGTTISNRYKIAKYLISKGANVFHKDNYGQNALMWAAGYGHISLVELFLSRGVHINEVDRYGNNAFLVAVIKKRIKMMNYLVLKGADYRKVDNNKANALFFSIHNKSLVQVKYCVGLGLSIHSRNKYNLAAFELACIKGNYDVIKYMIEKGADVNLSGQKGRKPLECVFEIKNVKLLLDSGAKINGSRANGFTALMSCINNSSGYKKMEYLLKRGANVNQRTKSKSTALFFAVQSHNLGMVKLLVKYGANVNIRDKRYNTPLTYAQRYGKYYKIIQFLQSRGAKN